MWGFTAVRPGERRDVFGGALTVFVVLLAHGVLETARDALFLSNLPATRLPWVYLAVAGLGLVATQFPRRSPGQLRDRRALWPWPLAAAAGTGVFWLVPESYGTWVFYALYVWAGLASMGVLIRFWLLMTERHTASEAKRLFPIVSAGSVIGAMTGFGVAGLLTWLLPAKDLLAVSAVLFAVAGGAVFVMTPCGPRTASMEGVVPRGEPASGLRSAAVAVANPYVLRVGLLLLVASLTVTIGDFLFKSGVAKSVAPGSLDSFFAATYFGFNALSLALLAMVTPFVRRVGVTNALIVLPVLLLGGAIAFALTASLASVMVLRGSDGALRFSLHKTATELLYVPMSSRLRSAVKGVVDVVAHRGGQAIGSMTILGFVAVGSVELVWMTIGLGAVAWIVLARSLREPYLDLFRRTLAEGTIPTRLDFPELDLASLETLVSALNSPDDRKVLAAMDMLREMDRVSLIPALIFYHPSSSVVARALDLFAEAERDDFLPMMDRLLDHESPEVRAAAVRARTSVRPSAEFLRGARELGCPIVDMTALVGLVARRWMPAEEGVAALERHLEDGASEDPCGDVGPFLARAIRYQPSPLFTRLLDRLVCDGDMETRLEAIKAMRASGDARHLPVLISRLPERRLRQEVRGTFLAMGEPALSHMAKALRDPATPRLIRLHLPRSISPFENERAADVLLRQFLVEPSGWVRYKILRGLGRMIANRPRLRLDPDVLDQVIRRILRRILELVHWRVVLEQEARDQPRRRTPGHELLTQLLLDKERHAVERLFRALGLRYRREDVARIYRGLSEGGSQARSSSRELLESLLPPRLGTTVLGLIDDLPDEDRLREGTAYYKPETWNYEEVLANVVRDASETLCAIAEYHAAEIGLATEGLEARTVESRFAFRLQEQARAAFRARSRESVRVGGER